MKHPLIILFVVLLTSCIKNEEADIVIHNATIYIVNEGFETAQAMAIRGDTIVEVGPEHQIRNKYRAKEVIDARMRYVYPGFIDGHCHFLAYGRGLSQLDVSGSKSFEEVLEKVAGYAETNTKGWITGRGWDQNDWENKSFPDKSALDSLFPDRPVVLSRVDGHAVLANSAALKAAGITPDTTIDGGVIEIQNGSLSGILLDNAAEALRQAIPPFSAEADAQALKNAQENCFRVGLTTVSDAGLDVQEILLIDSLQRAGELDMRVYAMVSDNEENFRYFMENGPMVTDRLTVRSFKFYADGALGSRGAALLSPYTDAPETTGLLLRDPAYYAQKAKLLYDAGWQMNTHCIGDSAVRLMLDVYGNALGGMNDSRWRIEHAQVVHPQDMEKFGKFSVVPSIQPTHATSDMYWAEERLGETRMPEAYPYQSLLQQNGMVTLGTDFPVEDISPLKTFYAAVTRQDAQGFPEGGFLPDEKLTREQTLKGMTIWAAIANFEEAKKGSLEPGKLADLVMLDRDIMKVPPEEILNANVVLTILNGEKVYQK